MGDLHPRICIYQRYLPPDPSGAGKQALTLARELSRRDVPVTLLGDRFSSESHGDIGGIPALWVEAARGGGYGALLAYWGRLATRLVEISHTFDVLQVQSAAFEQIGAIPVARTLGKGVVVRTSIAGELRNLGHSRSGRLHRRILQLAQGYIALSRKIAAEMHGSGLPPERVDRIPNGVDGARFRPVKADRKNALRRELELPQSGRIMIFHGVFIERKSLHWLVEVVGPVLKYHDLHLVLVGGPTRDEDETGYATALQRQIAAAPFAERIHLPGYSHQVERYLQAADLYVLPSTGEGLPNALLEAMACGLVPLATRTSGTEDVIEDGVCGFLFEPRNSKSFLAALERCLSEGGEQLGALSRAAASRIEKEFTIAAIADRYMEMYQRAWSQGRSRGRRRAAR